MVDQESQEPGPPSASALGRLDAWMARHPWHPRVVPFLVYCVFLVLTGLALERLPVAYPLIYSVQCGLVLALLWRYRRLLPELTLRFHWLALPVGAGVAAAWIALGLWMVELFPHAFADLAQADFRDPDRMGPSVGWIALGLRLVGMSVVVPMFEELFVRSLLLRSLARSDRTFTGLVQVAQDIPVLGEWIMKTRVGIRADRQPPVFGREFETNPLGRITVFGVAASTLVFASYHHPRDFMGILVCGVAYCLLVSATNRRQPGRPDHGLGPVIWAHGITNALLWVYTLGTGDWQFL